MVGVARANNGLLPIEGDIEDRAIGFNLHHIPFVGGYGHGIDLGDIYDRTGAILLFRARIEDVHLVARHGAGLGGIGAADEDTAIGGGIDPDLGPDLEVGIGVLRDEKSAHALIRLDGAVHDSPIGIADSGEIVHVGAVKKRDPACIGLGGKHLM